MQLETIRVCKPAKGEYGAHKPFDQMTPEEKRRTVLAATTVSERTSAHWRKTKNKVSLPKMSWDK